MLLLDFFKERNRDRSEALANKIMDDWHLSLKFLESHWITSNLCSYSLYTNLGA